jgi:hypothetical protein
MVVTDGAIFDDAEAIQERLRRAPGAEAQQEAAATPTGPPPSRWTLRTIRVSLPQLQSYSLSGVWRVLHRCQLRLRSARVRHFSPDEAYLEKQAHLLACLREAKQNPEKVGLVFLDEMGYYRWPEPGPEWGAMAPSDAPLADRAGPNNKQWRIVGSLDALSGRVCFLDGYIVGRRQLIEFYGQLDQAYEQRERLYVVQDNWSVHRHEEVMSALEGRPRLVPVWLPTYAPWLNPIEKLWRWLRADVLTLHRLAGDWEELRRRVNGFLDQFACGSSALLRYVGLLGEGKLAAALKSS